MKRKRILLIKPFSGRIDDIAPPLGLAYIASYLRAEYPAQCDIRIVDLRIGNRQPSAIRFMAGQFKPDIVGVSACSEEDSKLHEIARYIKKQDKNIPVIAGGPHATMCSEDILDDTNIDIAVIGEGEISFCRIFEKLYDGGNVSGIPGIAYRENGTYIKTKPVELIGNLDELPFPAWDLLDIDAYSNTGVLSMNLVMSGRKYMGIITSRGCPYKCIFCHNIFGRNFRKRSAENVFSEIKLLREKYCIDEFHVFDDIFNLDLKRLHKICDMIIESGIDVKICFPNGIRGDILDSAAILKLKKAGTYMITFALESASDRIQKMIKKNINKKKLLQNIRCASRLGLLTKCYFMIGFPTETVDEMLETVDFACRAPLDFAGFFVVTPQKKTELYDIVKDNYAEFELDYDSSCHYYAGKTSYEKVIKKPLKKIQRYAYRRFYLNITRIIRLLVRMPRKIIVFRNALKITGYFI
ncbi:MAG: radical SAM protein [Elusimicrobiota bacterium]